MVDAPFKNMGGKEGQLGVRCLAIVCSNPECEATSVSVSICPAGTSGSHLYIPKDAEATLVTPIIPQGSAKPQPDYIPKPIRQDYTEACLISRLSPKASATLIRRCLQGMIRDFCGIRCHTLNQEISELRGMMREGNAPRGVSDESILAIDHVRQIGNIGAHMEKDISVIVDVDENEARSLIELAEMLFQEWYVQRHQRQERLEKLKKIAGEKQDLRKATSSQR